MGVRIRYWWESVLPSVVLYSFKPSTLQACYLLVHDLPLQGRPWPAGPPSQAGAEPEDAAAVCVSVHLRPRLQPPPAAATTAPADSKNMHSSSDKQSQQQQQVPSLCVHIGSAADKEQDPESLTAAAAASPVPAAAAALMPASPGGDADDGLCTICYDQQACCVFMECGHGGYCWRCAHVLFARPPSECPVCRQPIQQVVELEDPAGCRVGRPARVKVKAAAAKPSGAWFKS